MAITIGIIALVVICIVLASRGGGRNGTRSGFNGFTWFDGGDSGGSDCGGGFDGGGGGGGDGGAC